MLNDDTSMRPEPFDLTKLKEFNPAYLAGFYADRFDVGIDEAYADADMVVGNNKALEGATIVLKRSGSTEIERGQSDKNGYFTFIN